MASLDEFSKRMAAIAQNVADNADRLVQKVALAVDTAVVQGTPVLTGRARSNWLPELNTIPTEVRYPSPQKPPSPEAGAQESMDGARAVVAKYKENDTIHITNNLPYIKKLNEGSSAQAPAGFVEKAVVAARDAIDSSGSILADVTTEEI